MRHETRSIRHLGPLVEALKPDQVDLIDTGSLAALVEEVQIDTPLNVVAQCWAARRWLLDTGVRGVYEFAPGSHAGPFSRGGPFTTLRAQLMVHPMPTRVCLSSALWLHGLTDRAPEPTHELSIPTGQRCPASLRRTYRVVHHTPALPPLDSHQVPLDQPATKLAHLAVSPTSVHGVVGGGPGGGCAGQGDHG